jgi:hypothetical protein
MTFFTPKELHADHLRRSTVTSINSVVDLTPFGRLAEWRELRSDTKTLWLHKLDEYLKNAEYHQCHFCGTYVYEGWETNHKRHYLSDCRPDLVQHELGPLCTWPYHLGIDKDRCYAYQDRNTNQWGETHEHFYEDGPM